MLLATENECNQSKKRGKFSASWLFLFCQAWKTIIMNLTHGRCAHSRIAGFGCDFHYDIDQNHPYAGIFIPFSFSSRRLSIRSIVPFSFVYALWLSHLLLPPDDVSLAHFSSNSEWFVGGALMRGGTHHSKQSGALVTGWRWHKTIVNVAIATQQKKNRKWKISKRIQFGGRLKCSTALEDVRRAKRERERQATATMRQRRRHGAQRHFHSNTFLQRKR